LAAKHVIHIPTLKARLEAPDGALLADVLSSGGIALSLYCGRRGICGKCVVEVRRGKTSPPSESESALLLRKKLSPRHRLACLTRIHGDLEIDLPGGSTQAPVIVLDEGLREPVTPDPAIKKFAIAPPKSSLASPHSLMEAVERAFGGRLSAAPGVAGKLPEALAGTEGRATIAVLDGRELLDAEPGETEGRCFGIAADIGTSTVVVELIDLVAGRGLGRTAAVNAQVPFGADVVSRISRAFENPGEFAGLTAAIRGQLRVLILGLAESHEVRAEHIYEIVVAGNTAMSHIFFGVPVTTLALAPFHGVFADGPDARAGELGLGVHPRARVYAAPNIQSFVGGDISAGLAAVNMSRRPGRTLFVDLGTNGEIVLKAGRRTTTTSTAAGPAFEGMTISCGMPAFPGAIFQAKWKNGFAVRTIGNVQARGICGTGLIDILALSLRRGFVSPDGRMTGPSKILEVAPDISLSQADVRKLQLAVAAVKSGIRMMLARARLGIGDLDEILVAGAFGVSLDIRNAVAVGLLPDVGESKTVFVGNASLAGARKLLLSLPERRKIEAYARRIGHVSLASEASFQDSFVEALELKPYSGDSR
jgi:uncharacterized 2Fe-2S/4Fe-4S cluster protein (DUF4445 family)